MLFAEIGGILLILGIILFLGGVLSEKYGYSTMGVILLVIAAFFMRLYRDYDAEIDQHHSNKQKKEKLKQRYFEKYGEKY